MSVALVVLLGLPIVAPTPSPATCLEFREFLNAPVGPDAGAQWVRIRNRCNVAVSAVGTELRWSGSGRWTGGGTLSLDQLGGIASGACVTVGGPIKSPATNYPTYDLAAPFEPELAVATVGMEAIGLFMVKASAPFAAVFYGDDVAGGMVGTNGEVMSEADVVQVPEGRSFWSSNGKWFDNHPSPHSGCKV